MELAQFEAMVARLERESARSPRAYQTRVALLALLGFGLMAFILGVLGLGLLLIGGVVVALVATGGAALLVLLKLGKLLVFLAVPLWVLVRTTLSALLTRLPAPQGHEVKRAEAPALFAAIDHMRGRLRGPRVHHVLVVDEMNAAVVQRPLLGLAGWPRNYLILGLPLLESVAPEEALAVVAHEYGHLSGSHGRFGAFIYRLRHTWGTLQDLAHRWQGVGGRALRRLVDGYAPYFNAYTFVLARANEYQADAASADLVGAPVVAAALKRVNVAEAQYEAFLGRTLGAIRTQAQPPGDLAVRWAGDAVQAPAAALVQDWLARALDRRGQAMDTHPPLRERLAALPGQADALQQPPPPLHGPSAAQAWFGPHLQVLRQAFQARWAAQMGPQWEAQHKDWQARRARREELLALPQPTVPEQIELLQLRMQFAPDTDHRDALAAFNAAHPDQPQALWLEGSERLARDDEAGLALLDRAAGLDPDAIKPACVRAHAFLRQRDDARAQAYAERWNVRDTWERERALQLQTLDAAHELREHGLAGADLEQVRRLLRNHGDGVAHAWLARRVLPADEQVRTFVLALQLTRWARWRKRDPAIIERLAASEWPVHVMLCSVRAGDKAMLPRLRALPGSLIDPRAGPVRG